MRTRFKVTAVVALLSIAFYALLLPWHLTSQFAQQLFSAKYDAAASLICHSGPIGNDPVVPGAPETNCPICKGLGALDLAISPPSHFAPAAPAVHSVYFDQGRENLVGAGVPTPRSRGPPLSA
jgi:hypothetical protein